MTVQLSDTVRNTQAEAIESSAGVSALLKIYSGAQPANCAAADPTGLLVTITLPSDWMGAGSGGVVSKLGTWSATASATGTAASFRIKDSGDTTCHMQGSVGQGTGDLQLDNTSIASGQTVTVSTFQWTQGDA